MEVLGCKLTAEGEVDGKERKDIIRRWKWINHQVIGVIMILGVVGGMMVDHTVVVLINFKS